MAQKSLDLGAIAPATDGSAEPRVVPPMRVEARPGPDDSFALLARRRQRPRRRDLVRVGQVFEEETPVLRVFVPLRLEASRNQPRRHRRRDLRVERHLLPPAVPAACQAFREPGLENERGRSARLQAIVDQTEFEQSSTTPLPARFPPRLRSRVRWSTRRSGEARSSGSRCARLPEQALSCVRLKKLRRGG